jgi:two-component system response regulator YesN
MNHILLVEDEPLFRKGLAKMITGSETNWHVCGEAENGQEAEILIAERLPDLVITDIRMPLMDGLELLKRTKAKYPHIEFIVITGFQDFQYAQAALRHGALDLLIKPCGKQDIFDALDKAEVRVLEKQANLRKTETEHALLLENTLRGILLGFPYRPELASELEKSLVGCKLTLFQIMDYMPSHKQYAKRDMPLLQFAVLNMISELTDMHGIQGRLLVVENGQFAFIYQETEDEKFVCNEACETVERLLGLQMSLYCAGAASGLAQLAELYEAGRRMVGTLAGSADVKTDAQVDKPTNRAQQQLISTQTIAFILAGQIEPMKQYLAQLMKEIYALPVENGKVEALSFSFALQDTARKQFEMAYEPHLLTERITLLHTCGTNDEVSRWTGLELDRFMSSFTAWQEKYSENVVWKAARYMEEHYAEQLPLQFVASLVHLNATYFSHLFKKETGRSFVDYLIELRMEKAKGLLANTDMKITEVSGVVGYDLPNYFAKLFKQTTGLSPKDYRKMYRQDPVGNVRN